MFVYVYKEINGIVCVVNCMSSCYCNFLLKCLLINNNVIYLCRIRYIFLKLDCGLVCFIKCVVECRCLFIFWCFLLLENKNYINLCKYVVEYKMINKK